ncbi:MAG: efflux RND transporter periplasmic adaptor subunit [Paracoccaceae bacterium]
MTRIMTALVLCLSAGIGLAGQAGAQTAGAAHEALKASVMVLEPAEVPVSVTLSGRAIAVAEARVRPLIAGLVTEIPYQPGQEIKAGTVLFRIDRRSYEAQVITAEAALESARAAVPAKQAAVERAERLAGTGTTQATLDTARVELRQAEAAVQSAEASLDLARLSLERTDITSPIDGVVSVPGVSVGDLVTANQTDVLATVTSLDPIHVDMSDSSARMMRLGSQTGFGQPDGSDRIGVVLTLENGEAYSGTGTIEAVGSTVSTTTGTRTIRVRFDNPDRVILPGMFVRAKLTLGTAKGVLVPQRSVSVNTDGTLEIWTLDAEDKARAVTVDSSGEAQNSWVVTKGVMPGATVILDNLDKLTEGSEIHPIPSHVDAQGLIVQDAPPADAGENAGDKAAEGAAQTAPTPSGGN